MSDSSEPHSDAPQQPNTPSDTGSSGTATDRPNLSTPTQASDRPDGSESQREATSDVTDRPSLEQPGAAAPLDAGGPNASPTPSREAIDPLVTMAAAATAFAAGAAEGADLDSGSAGGGHTDQPADGPTIAEGLAALPPSPGEIPRAVQDAFDKVEQAAKEDPLAAINEFGNLMSVTAQELFGRQLGGGGQGEALENKVAKAEGSEGFGTSFRGEAAEAGAAVAGELGEAGLEVLAAGGQAMGEFLGSVVSAAGDMIEKGAAGLEALGKGDVGEAAALFGEGVVDTLDEAADAGLAVIKGGIGMAGEVIEGAGEVAREIGEGAAEMAQGAVNDVSDAISEFVDRPW